MALLLLVSTARAAISWVNLPVKSARQVVRTALAPLGLSWRVLEGCVLLEILNMRPDHRITNLPSQAKPTECCCL